MTNDQNSPKAVGDVALNGLAAAKGFDLDNYTPNPEIVLEFDKDPSAPAERQDATPATLLSLKQAVYRKHNLVDFEQLHANDLDERETKLLEGAIKAAGWYVNRLQLHQSDPGDEPVPGLVLLSGMVAGDPQRPGTGTGKTMLARAIATRFTRLTWPAGEPLSAANVLLERRVRFVTDYEFQQHANNDEIGALIRPHDRLIVLDDIGTARPGFVGAPEVAAVRQYRYLALVNACIARDVGLVITANIAAKDFATFVGAQAWSRIGDMAPKGYIRDLTGVTDFRYRRSGRAS